MSGPSGGGLLLAASRLVAVGTALLALLGLFGSVHPALDSLAHFRAHLAVLAILSGAPSILLCARALRRGRLAFGQAAGGLAALTGVALLLPVLPYLGVPWPGAAQAAGGRSYTLLQMNLRFDAAPEAAVRRIEEARPDVVTLEEVTGRWREVMEGLSGDYPFQAYCRRGYSVGATAILSRHPFAGPDFPCSPGNGFSAQPVDLDGQRVTVVAQHLNWPWPHGQWRQIEALSRRLTALPEPAIVAGDFNATPWSAAVRTYAEAGGLEVAPGVGPTWLDRRVPHGLAALVGLPIDNVLHSPDVEVLSVRRLDPTASDHLPVLVTFAVRGGA